MDQKTEAEIVAEVLKGDKQAYALLIDAYKRPLFNLALRMTGSYADADDLTQETFIRAYQKLHQFDREKKFFTWLYTIGINLIRNHLKKKVRDSLSQSSDYPIPESQTSGRDSGEGEQHLEDGIRMLDENMRKLPVGVREAIILKYHQDLTFEEVADITGDSLGAVKMRVYRGLQKLKKLMNSV